MPPSCPHQFRAPEHPAHHPLGSAHSALRVGAKVHDFRPIDVHVHLLNLEQVIISEPELPHGMGTIKGSLWAVETIA